MSDPKAKPWIQRENGALAEILDVIEAAFDGNGASRAKFSLCRCAMSKNKPFCDGARHDAGWSDD